jgi:prepilin-type processing-associated H-X9-DG protein
MPSTIPTLPVDDAKALAVSQSTEWKLTFLWLPGESTQVNIQSGEPNNTSYKINGDKFATPLSMSQPQQTYYARPSAIHTGGVNVAFCDARITFLREDISYRVYTQLLTANGEKANSAPWIRGYSLNSADYEQ